MLKKSYLFTPGPTMVPPEVLAAEAQTMMHHRTPQFSKIIDEVVAGTKELFGTQHDVFIIASSGTGGMETAVCNIVNPGDTVICAQAGKFGERWGKICTKFGAKVILVEKPAGQSFSADDIAPVVKANPGVKAVYVTHSETSTGALSDIESIARVTRDTDAVLVVDAITTIGIQRFDMDKWGVDIAVTGSQKGCMLSPGLAFIAVAPKAWKAVEACKSPRFYFDLPAMKKNAAKSTTPFTPAISLIRAMHESLRLMKEEGLDAVFERHERLAQATRTAVKAMGLTLLASRPANVVTAVNAPAGIDAKKLVKNMRDQYGVTIAAGQDELETKIFRVGHMGFVNEFDVLVAIGALERGLHDLGYKFEIGAGLAAAQKYFLSSQK